MIMDVISSTEWEVRVGEQVRALRIAALMGQDELAERANVSTGALRRLERGTGSTLKTLVAVLRVLERTEWLTTLDPIGDAPSPIERLRAQRRQRPRRQRVPRSR